MILTIMICCILMVLIGLATFGEINKIRVAIERKNTGDNLIENLNKLTEWSQNYKTGIKSNK